ncbi:hypothetical protein F5Y15DRAFT_85261 [Xylariaceae sp. FL0016]|nr:hypothetical protein F5Y15DRAFT_85261 [Xylariaceae sp. FL0016]
MLRPIAQTSCQRALVRPIGLSKASRSHLTRFRSIQYSTISQRCRASTRHLPVRHFQTSHARFAQRPSKARTPSPKKPASTPGPTESVPEPHQPPPRSRRRRRRSLYFTVLFLLTGFSLGNTVRLAIAPPPPAARDSIQDRHFSSSIRKRGAAHPLVARLEADPDWISWDAYSGLSDADPDAGSDADSVSPSADPTSEGGLPASASTARPSALASRITSGPLAGSAGLPYQRVFHNPATSEVVSLIYFGAGTGGWPGIVHGGALATVLDESLGRCAILRFPSRTGVTARLELAYKRPTMTKDFYIIRARPVVDAEGASEAVGKDGTRKSDRKMWVEGTLETGGGKVCVEAKALFVVPKGFELKPLVKGF